MRAAGSVEGSGEYDPRFRRIPNNYAFQILPPLAKPRWQNG